MMHQLVRLEMIETTCLCWKTSGCLREGGRGTDITTLPGGSNLGEIEDIRYLQKKLYQSLNVPFSRMDSEAQGGLQLGKATEVSRDEIKFTKYIGRLRKKFIHLFSDTLKTQVILKGIVSEDDWNNISFLYQIRFHTRWLLL